MRLKTIVAPDAARALARVRDLLGQDAIIVTTQDLKQGGVRVTAAMDEDDLDLADLLAPVERAGAPPWLIDLAEHHDLAPALVTGLEQALAGAIDVDPAVALDRALQQMFRFAPLPPASPTPCSFSVRLAAARPCRSPRSPRAGSSARAGSR